MSGVTDRDISAIEYLVARLREETTGANKWDAPGIHAKVAEFKGQNLEIALERAFRNAADPKAKTPGAMHRSFTPPAASEKPRPELVRNPRRGEDCPTHPGQWPATCAGCATDGREAVYDDDTTDTTPFRDAKAAAFAAARQARGLLPLTEHTIIHQPGCTWETTPHCDCGADPERTTPTEEDATEETPNE